MLLYHEGTVTSSMRKRQKIYLGVLYLILSIVTYESESE